MKQFENKKHRHILDQVESINVGGGIEEIDLSRVCAVVFEGELLEVELVLVLEEVSVLL
jgi:hypothetical protein